MYVFSFLMILSSLTLLTSSHPVSIFVMIFIQTFLICVMMWVILKNSWFSYILFLIFLGGLMVLFVYIISLASNEKFESNIETTKTTAFLTFTLMALTSMMFFFEKNINTTSVNFFQNIKMIFSESLFIPTSLIMFYLFFTLIVAVKISSKFEGPLRNFIK